jgi:hypothetical protein
MTGAGVASYRFSMDIIGRSAGRSATAAAAYRSGERIECERTGETHDYTRKGRNVLHSEIMAPDDAPEWATDRAKLWNAVEAGEKRIDAQLSREIQLSLPHELTDAQRIELVRGFVTEQLVSRGLVADVAVHRPHDKGDSRNHHAHIMLTTRPLEADGFGAKMIPQLDPETGEVKRTKKGKIVYDEFSGHKDDLNHWREEWANHQNREFERLGLEARVDHRSFEAQGIDREPEQHEGPHATAMKRKKQDTRIGQENADKRERNSARAWQHVAALKELAQIAAERARFTDWANERSDHLRAAQTESLREMDDHHERQARGLSDELDAFYGPHLRTVQAEAGRIHQRQEAKGIFSTLRRIWTGRSDRDKLDQMQATIADTKQRMDEAKGKLSLRQQAERTRLQELQQTRAAQQRDGLETAQQRKEQALKPRENAARAVWEKATDPERAAAHAERERRLAWYEQRKAPTQEAAAIDGPPKAKVSAREAQDRELHDRAKGIDTRFNNSRLHVNRDVIERIERADHNAQYERNMKAKAEAEAEAPAKAAELARLREIAANRMDELNRQATPAQEPAQAQKQSLKDRVRATMQEPQQAAERGQLAEHHAAAQEPPTPSLSLRERAAAAMSREAAPLAEQRVPEPQREAENAARALWENTPIEPQPDSTPSPARALWENATPAPEPTSNRQELIEAARSISDEPTHSRGFER